MNFYIVRQNNIGGRFVDPARNIIIEAENTGEVDKLIEQYERPDLHCACCLGGPRWDRFDQGAEGFIYATVNEDDLNKILLGTVEVIPDALPKAGRGDINDYHIIYANGRVVSIKE